MSPNYSFALLKHLFKKEEKNDTKERGMDKKINKKRKELIEKENGLDIPKTLRSEYNFLKFPFFNLCTRQSKMEAIEILEEEETEEGKIEIWWRVSRNIKSNFPSSFARKLHKEVIEKILNKLKKPAPRLIKLGSFNQICRNMNIAISGKNKKDIKRALKDIRGAKIEAKGTFRLKGKNGQKKFFEGDFNLYDGVYFTGEQLPDKTEADAVYVCLSDYYVQNFNNNFVVPIDYHYFRSLGGDVASRMYEVLSVWFYPALENGKSFVDKKYSELCNYFPLARQNTKWKVKGQLKRAHQQHIINGFLGTEPEWVNIGQRDNWMIRYWIGEKAKEWHKQNKRNKKIGNEKEDVKQLEEPEKKEEGRQDNKKQQDVINQLSELGVTKKVAERLVKDSNIDFIEDWIDAVHETKAENKAAFLVKAIQEKWEVPEPFKKKKEKLVREKEEKREEDVKERYNQYIINGLDEYIKKIDKEVLEKELKEYEDIYYQKYPFYKQFKESDKMKPYIERDYKHNKAKEIGLLSFEEWEEGQKLTK